MQNANVLWSFGALSELINVMAFPHLSRLHFSFEHFLMFLTLLRLRVSSADVSADLTALCRIESEPAFEFISRVIRKCSFLLEHGSIVGSLEDINSTAGGLAGEKG